MQKIAKKAQKMQKISEEHQEEQHDSSENNENKAQQETHDDYVVDTSALIEHAVSKLVRRGFKGAILVPNAVVSELEHQANQNQETGFLGLEELEKLQKYRRKGRISIEFIGSRPSFSQIKLARSGEIDAIIRDIAFQRKAMLLTADNVQAKSAEAYGIDVRFIKIRRPHKKLSISRFFGKDVMSIHLKEKSFVYGKKGKPGDWKLVRLNSKPLKRRYIQKLAKEIVEKSRMTSEAFLEILRPGLSIVQYFDHRIVIVKPPLADGWEITVIRPLHKFDLEHYQLPLELRERLVKARGIIISGEPGSGKSTFCQALAEFYAAQGRIVKTVESPRDLQLSDKITQYSKSFASSQDMHDILFLSRPDYIIFDEMRDTPDFSLYADLRLAGSECLGVLHASSPIDSVQRFTTRLDVGTIPSVFDIVVFMQNGIIKKVLEVSLQVKVPTGMKQQDLVRPVVEVRDFETKQLEYELYRYADETVIVRVKKHEPLRTFAGFAQKQNQDFNIYQKKNAIFIEYVKKPTADLIINNRFLATLGFDQGKAKIKRKSHIGQALMDAIRTRKSITLE